MKYYWWNKTKIILKNELEKKYEQKRKEDHSLPKDVSFDEFLEKIEFLIKEQNKFQIIDPYMKWIVQKYVTADGIRYFEDIHSKTIPALLTYDALKRKNKLKPEYKDITKIKSLNNLLDILDEYKEEDIKSKKEQEKDIEQKFYESGEAELLYNDSEIKVVIPKTEKASCFFGKNTRWCTAATKSNNMFWYYSKRGDLYIVIIKKTNERYQFHFETNQFMDEKDESINLIKLAEKYPKLYDIFEPIAKLKKSIIFRKDLSEEEKIKAIKQNPFLIQYIKNPSEILQLIAVNENPRLIQYIENPGEKVQLVAVSKDGHALQYIKNPSEKVQMTAVKENGFAILHLKTPSRAIKIAAIKKNGYAIQYIENPSEIMKLVAVNQNGFAIKYIESPSEAIQLAAIVNNPRTIEHIENPNERVQLEAVKRNLEVIKYIKNPTPKVFELVEKMKSKSSS